MAKPLQRLVGYLWTVVSFLQEELQDPETRAVLIGHLNLDPTAAAPTPIDTNRINQIEAYLASNDPDTLAFFQTADSLAAIIGALEGYVTPLLTAESPLSAFDTIYTWIQLLSIQSVRHQAPVVYTVARLIGLIDDEIATHKLPHLSEPSATFKKLYSPFKTEEDARAIADSFYLAPMALGLIAHYLATTAVDRIAYGSYTGSLMPEEPPHLISGWDLPEIESPEVIGLTDSMLSRAITWQIDKESDTGLGLGLTTTWIPIPKDHGGPGMFMSIGGNLTIDVPPPNTPDPQFRVKARFAFPEAVSFFLTGSSEITDKVQGNLEANAELEYLVGKAVSGVSALAVPNDTGSRIEIGTFGVRVILGEDDLRAELVFDDAALVLASKDPDSFLASVFPSGGLRADFDLKVGYDFLKGEFYFGGSTKLAVVIPIGKSLGPLSIYHITVGLSGPEGSAGHFELAIGMSLSLKLFAVTGVVDQIGYRIALPGVGSGGRLGLIDNPEFDFVPPRGIGLKVDAKSVSGSGFIYLDADNNEYAGFLDLKYGKYMIKVFGLIKTGLDTSPEFSLIFFGSVEGLRISLFAGGHLTGFGLVFGMHRTMSVEAFQASIKNRTLDAIMFPEDPVGNAPTLLQTLKTLFPVSADQWIVGLSVQADWISKKIVKIEAGLLVEFPSPVRVVLLGQVDIGLPNRTRRLLDLKFGIVGILDFEAKFLSIDAGLYDSRIGKFPLTGGLAVRARWGDPRSGAAAIGGLHPRFDLPEGFPRLDRLSISLGKGKNPRIRGYAYFGLTSNTIQFGLGAEFYVSAGGFSLEGNFSLDLLFGRNPFQFKADLSFNVAVKYRGRTLAGLHLSGIIEGPGPWHAKGKVRIKLLFFKITKRFETSWGDPSQEAIAAVPVWPELEAALLSSENWSGELTSTLREVVPLRAPPVADVVYVHPLGALEVVQRVVPLGVEMDIFNGAPITGDRRFDIKKAKLQETETDVTLVFEHFAPGQHINIEGDSAISRPSFEEFPAGARFGSQSSTVGPTITINFEYEEVVINDLMTRPSPYGRYQISAPAMLAAAENGAVAGAISSAGGRYAGPRHHIRRTGPRFIPATFEGLELHQLNDDESSEGASYTQTIQAVERHLAKHAEDRGRVQVIRDYEVQTS